MAHFEGEPKEVNAIFKAACPSCGGKLHFAAERQLLACEYCGYTEDVNRSDDQVLELSLKEALRAAKKYQPSQIGEKVVHCGGCGARYLIQQDAVSLECSFCASSKVNLEAFDEQLIQPSGILPFQISKKEALDKYQKWIRRGWFYPSKLKKMAALEQLHGVYLPFWTFDAQTESEWSGEAGYHYTETVRIGSETKEEQRTRWEYRSGHLSHFFDDLLVIASEGIDNPDIQRVLTSFSLEKVINFDPRLLLGWQAEVYQIDLDKSARIADKIMDSRLRGMCLAKIGGDTQRNLSIKTQKKDWTFKHVLLPAWVCAYRYNGKAYQFVVNGQTGRVGGKKPLSWTRIALAVVLGLVLLAAAFWAIDLIQNGNY